jgi:hypothetical protein
LVVFSKHVTIKAKHTDKNTSIYAGVMGARMQGQVGKPQSRAAPGGVCPLP